MVKIVFFTFYYPPDLCAGSFRAVALVKSLSEKLSRENDELHVVTTYPNRYASHIVDAEEHVIEGNVTIHRIRVPGHKSGMLSQGRTFVVFAWYAFRYCMNIKPDFLVGTTSRLMTGGLTWLASMLCKKKYFIDLRDIFSETISDILSRKNRWLGFTVKKVFSLVERRVLMNAAGVNVVSQGFPDYYAAEGIDTSDWSFYPNGVDQEFAGLHKLKQVKMGSAGRNVRICYAGNIGSGQGLESILPEMATLLGSKYQFQVIGDGGARLLLEQAIELVDNVELLPAMSRTRLIQYYKEADILFLHLNDLPAFMRVLPSKIFEYAALGKPVVAGISGYSAAFLRENVPYACIFEPGDVSGGVRCIREALHISVDTDVVEQFSRQFSRDRIMPVMADHILDIARA